MWLMVPMCWADMDVIAWPHSRNRALVVEGAPEEAVAVATEFVDGLLEEREWAARLVKVAAKLYSPTAVDKAPPDNWLVCAGHGSGRGPHRKR
jgi:hypothetical protein